MKQTLPGRQIIFGQIPAGLIWLELPAWMLSLWSVLTACEMSDSVCEHTSYPMFLLGYHTTLQRWHSFCCCTAYHRELLSFLLFFSVCFICFFFFFFLYFCLSPGWLSEWVVGCVVSSLTAVWEPSCHSRSSLVPLSFWSQSPLI